MPPQGSRAMGSTLAIGGFGSLRLAPSCLSNRRHTNMSAWLPLLLCLQPNTGAPGNDPWEQAGLQDGMAALGWDWVHEAGCRRSHPDPGHGLSWLQRCLGGSARLFS